MYIHLLLFEFEFGTAAVQAWKLDASLSTYGDVLFNVNLDPIPLIKLSVIEIALFILCIDHHYNGRYAQLL